MLCLPLLAKRIPKTIWMKAIKDADECSSCGYYWALTKCQCCQMTDNVMFIHETSFQWNPKPAPENNGPDAQDLADLRLHNLRWLGDGEWSRKNGKWKQGKKEILILLRGVKLKLKLGHYQRGKLRKRQPENCGFLLANSATGDAGKKCQCKIYLKIIFSDKYFTSNKSECALGMHRLEIIANRSLIFFVVKPRWEISFMSAMWLVLNLSVYLETSKYRKLRKNERKKERERRLWLVMIGI